MSERLAKGRTNRRTDPQTKGRTHAQATQSCLPSRLHLASAAQVRLFWRCSLMMTLGRAAGSRERQISARSPRASSSSRARVPALPWGPFGADHAHASTEWARQAGQAKPSQARPGQARPGKARLAGATWQLIDDCFAFVLRLAAVGPRFEPQLDRLGEIWADEQRLSAVAFVLFCSAVRFCFCFLLPFGWPARAPMEIGGRRVMFAQSARRHSLEPGRRTK